MFYNMPNVKTVTFGSGITQWGSAMFGSISIETVTVKSPTFDTTVFSGGGYSGTYHINTLILDNSEMVVAERAGMSGGFMSVWDFNIDTIELRNVKTIGANSFISDNSPKQITVGNVGEIGDYAFSSSYDLHTLMFNGTVGSIGEAAFFDCPALETLQFNGTVESIGSSAFERCTSVVGDIVIPESCTYIGDFAFQSCDNITGLTIPETTKIGFSDIFLKFPYLVERMEAILDGKFQLGNIDNDDELTVPDGWTSSHKGQQNSTSTNGTQVTKAARWADSDQTTADVELQFSYTKTPGKDFLFVVDYSGSMAAIGNQEENDDSRFSDMQSKLLDVSDQLLHTEGYDNRVAFVSFATSFEKSLDFTNDYQAAEDFVMGDTPYGSTNYSAALRKASEMIQNRSDSSREAIVIFISDGQPNKFENGTGSPAAGQAGGWTGLVQEITSIADSIKAIKQDDNQTKIFGILQSVPASDEDRCTQVMQNVCTDGLFFNARDTQEFSDAVNDAIGVAFGRFVITDVVNEAFTLDTATLNPSFGTVTYDQDTRTITWDLTGALPYTDYTLSFQEKLVPDSNGIYPYGSFDTNQQDAVITESGAEVNRVSTPQLPRSGQQITITPADITIYTGGDGYDSVVNGNGNEIGQTNNGMPTPGFYVTLPASLNQQLLKQVNAADITVNDNGDKVIDLSKYLKFTYDDGKGNTREWKLERYDNKLNHESMAYNKYIYRILPAEVDGEEVPIRLQFTDGDTFMTSDDFTVNLNDLYHEYVMTIYGGALQQHLVKAVITIDENDSVYDAAVTPGTLTVRGITDDHTATTEVVTTVPETEVSNVTAQVNDGTHFFINGSELEVAEGDQVKLLVDSLVSGSENTLVGSAVEEYNSITDNYDYETRYLDLVDTSNGNVYVTASDTVAIYWPYPEGTDKNTKFQIVHYEGLDRNDNTDLGEGDYTMTLYSEENGNLENTDQGIRIEVDSFSPFALFWEKESTGGGSSSRPTPDDLNTEDHFAYIIGYPKDYQTGEPTDDESRWPIEPQGDITRAEVATIFFRMLTDEARSANWSQTNAFTDVASTDWYNNAISTLANMGILSGDPDGSFRPNDSITRAEFTKIAVSFFDEAGNYVDGTYADVPANAWYADFIDAAVDLGLIEGYPDGTIHPEASITRAEACTIVNRTLGRVPDKNHLLPTSEMRVWPDNRDTGAWYYAQMQEATNSHDYEWTGAENNQIENWTEKLEDRDWAALEKEWSDANSAPGGEVID